MGKITVEIDFGIDGAHELRTLADAIDELRTLADAIDAACSTKVDMTYDEVTPPPLTAADYVNARKELTKKRKRRTKAEIAAADKEVAEKLEFNGVDNLADPEEDEEGDGINATAEEGLPEIEESIIEPAKLKNKSKLTLESDVIPAFQAFVRKHKEKGRDMALGVLKKFDVMSVRDVPDEKYPALLSVLNG